MDTLTRLKNTHLFASLTPEDLARVADLAIRRSFPKGSALCRQDDFGETLYIIDSGEAIVHQTDLKGAERPIAYLREGGIAGEDALLLGDAYGSCVHATADVEALCIRKQDFDRLLQERPQIRKQLRVSHLIQERLRAPTFAWLSEGETPLLLRKRHWIVFMPKLLPPLLILFSLAIVAWHLYRAHINISLSLLFLLLAIAALSLLILLWFFIDWQNDFYLVTTHRIIHREKLVLLHESLDEAPLAKIQDTRIVYRFLGKLLGYGDMRIDTAGARGTIILDHLPDPEGMQDTIFKQVRYIKWKLQQEEREGIRQELLRQAGKTTAEELPHPPQFPPKKKVSLLARLRPSRPLLQLRYEQADRIVWRKHWVFLIKRIFLPLLAVLAVLTLAAIAFSRWPHQDSFPLLLVALVLWIPFLVWLWWEWEDWRNDEYILTDRLVIDVEKKPLFFSEERRQASLDMIQNVSLSIPGPLANILNYGDVLIQTAGAGGTLSFHNVPRPSEVQSEIFRRIEAYTEAQRRRERERRKAEIATWFQIYDEMKRQREPPASA